MAKLKCDQHKQRVHVINGKLLHRGGWGDMCKSPTATIGDKTYTPAQIAELAKQKPPVKLVGRIKKEKKDPADELLVELFTVKEE